MTVQGIMQFDAQKTQDILHLIFELKFSRINFCVRYRNIRASLFSRCACYLKKSTLTAYYFIHRNIRSFTSRKKYISCNDLSVFLRWCGLEVCAKVF